MKGEMSLWHSGLAFSHSLEGGFGGVKTQISLQDSTTKGHVVCAADFKIPPNEKKISEYNKNFSPSLCD